MHGGRVKTFKAELGGIYSNTSHSITLLMSQFLKSRRMLKSLQSLLLSAPLSLLASDSEVLSPPASGASKSWLPGSLRKPSCYCGAWAICDLLQILCFETGICSLIM